MKYMKQILFTMLVVAVSMLQAQNQDVRIEQQLKKMNLQYEVTSAGNFKLLFELEKGRTQIVFINSETKNHEDVQVREISSPAAFILKADELSHARMWQLLAANAEAVLGSWQLEPAADGWGLHYTVKVPALMPENRLLMYMVLVAKAADEMEKNFSAEDRF
jgi:hypothetical protein